MSFRPQSINRCVPQLTVLTFPETTDTTFVSSSSDRLIFRVTRNSSFFYLPPHLSLTDHLGADAPSLIALSVDMLQFVALYAFMPCRNHYYFMINSTVCSHIDPKVHTSVLRRSLYKKRVISAETRLSMTV